MRPIGIQNFHERNRFKCLFSPHWHEKIIHEIASPHVIRANDRKTALLTSFRPKTSYVLEIVTGAPITKHDMSVKNMAINWKGNLLHLEHD